jgi:uncharacterized membrane protein
MFSISHLHPMMVHFPIALTTFGFIAEFVYLFFKKRECLSEISLYLLIFGTFTGIITLLTGIFFTSEMSGAAGEVKETHELFAWITILLLAVTSIFLIFIKTKNIQNNNLNWLAFILYGLATITVSITGFYGGNLVYNFMMPL